MKTAIEKANTITQNAASSAEEMASSTEELSTQAENLKKLITQFRVGDESRGDIRRPGKDEGEKELKMAA